eukprot:3583439-Amphidinium_carterae.2
MSASVEGSFYREATAEQGAKEVSAKAKQVAELRESEKQAAQEVSAAASTFTHFEWCALVCCCRFGQLGDGRNSCFACFRLWYTAWRFQQLRMRAFSAAFHVIELVPASKRRQMGSLDWHGWDLEESVCIWLHLAPATRLALS